MELLGEATRLSGTLTLALPEHGVVISEQGAVASHAAAPGFDMEFRGAV
jgi:hypothetical protein